MRETLPSAILFVCGQNAIRSPMAEAIARSILPPTVYIASAGVQAGARDPFVDAVLAERGLMLGRRQPQALDDLEDDFFDLVVTLAPEAHALALERARATSTDVVHWPTDDPSLATGTREQILAAYRGVRDAIDRRIRADLLGTGAAAGPAVALRR